MYSFSDCKDFCACPWSIFLLIFFSLFDIILIFPYYFWSLSDIRIGYHHNLYWSKQSCILNICCRSFWQGPDAEAFWRSNLCSQGWWDKWHCGYWQWSPHYHENRLTIYGETVGHIWTLTSVLSEQIYVSFSNIICSLSEQHNPSMNHWWFVTRKIGLTNVFGKFMLFLIKQ